jgi:hypothetical protein
VTSRSGSIVQTLPAPWAMDASDNPVPASYSVSGNTLTLQVQHSDLNAYPVVADPCLTCIWGAVSSVAAAAAIVFIPATAPFWVGAGAAAAFVSLGAWGACSAYHQC